MNVFTHSGSYVIAKKSSIRIMICKCQWCHYHSGKSNIATIELLQKFSHEQQQAPVFPVDCGLAFFIGKQFQ